MPRLEDKLRISVGLPEQNKKLIKILEPLLDRPKMIESTRNEETQSTILVLRPNNSLTWRLELSITSLNSSGIYFNRFEFFDCRSLGHSSVFAG